MTQIKKGDKLRVLTTPSHNSKLTVGEIVTAAADQRDGFGGHMVDIEKNGNTKDYQGFFATRFEIVQDTPTKKAEVDFTKPLQTRDGRSVTLVTTEGRGTYPVLAYVGQNDSISTFTTDGLYFVGSEENNDIINVPKKAQQVTYYFNMYADGTVGSKFDTREAADQGAVNAASGWMQQPRIGVKKVVFTEGEFDA